MSDEPQNKKQPEPSGERTRSQGSSASENGSPAQPGPNRRLPEIEGYQIVGTEPLGEGGMGAVWRAIQLGTRQEVALKLINAAYLGLGRPRQLFEREVRLAASLQHPNIARVYDSGLHHGVYYYAMQLIDGGLPLDKYVQEKQLSQSQILELMRTVCQAVQAAHQRGVIHTDLKPPNILVSQDGQPYVLDFGLAKLLRPDELQPVLSSSGLVVGTPWYMSPEQAAGKRPELDTTTDVYSLGVILFELVTGQPPRESTIDPVEMCRRIIQDPVRRPSKLCKEVDNELEALLLKALADEPARRYRNAGKFGENITNLLEHKPVDGVKWTLPYFIKKSIQRHRKTALTVAAVVAVLTAGTVFSYVRVAREHNIAETERTHAKEAAKNQQAQQARTEAEARQAVEEAKSQRIRAEKASVLAEDAQRRVEQMKTEAEKASRKPTTQEDSQTGQQIADRLMVRSPTDGTQTSQFPLDPDGLTLNSGEIIGGRIISESKTDITVEVANATRTILSTRQYSKTEIKSVQREPLENKVERNDYEALLTQSLDANQEKSTKGYAEGVAVFERFLANHPNSRFGGIVRSWIENWEDEKMKVESGWVKFDNRWFLPNQKAKLVARSQENAQAERMAAERKQQQQQHDLAMAQVREKITYTEGRITDLQQRLAGMSQVPQPTGITGGGEYYLGKNVDEFKRQALATQASNLEAEITKQNKDLIVYQHQLTELGIVYTRQLAELGDIAAMKNLGDMYAYGNNVKQNHVEALKWYRQAAELGNVAAMVGAAAINDRVVHDKAEALKWFRKAAELGDSDGMNYLGGAYAKGNGVGQDKAEALKWFRKAAELGNTAAMVNLGGCYTNQSDVTEAFKWYRQAAERGSADGAYALGNMYANGNGVVKNQTEAAKWYLLAADHGSSEGMYIVGKMYAKGEMPAVPSYNRTTATHAVSSQPSAAVTEQQNNKTMATRWYRKAEEQGSSDLMYNLGNIFASGDGVDRDQTEAMRCYLGSANLGNTDAMGVLIRIYEQGNGVAKDHGESMKWYQRRAVALVNGLTGQLDH